MELEKLKEYLRVDFPDDDGIIQLILDAVMDEMQELIPGFDREAPTSRQKLLICTYAKEMYDNRDRTEAGQKSIRFAVQSMMMKEMLR